jgi:hypothetical protein
MISSGSKHRKEDAMQTVIGVFRSPVFVAEAFDRLVDLGYARDEINVLMSEEIRALYFGFDKSRSRALKGAAFGGVAGGGLGALLATGLLFGVPAIAAAGPLAAAMVGAGLGATTGSLVSLSDRSIPNTDIALLRKEIARDSIVMIIETVEMPAERIVEIFEECGASRTMVR